MDWTFKAINVQDLSYMSMCLMDGFISKIVCCQSV